MDLSAAHFTTVFNVGTTQNSSILALHYYDIAISVVVALIVFGLLIAAAVKFRYRPGQPEPVQDAGNHKLETAWTVATGVILLSLIVYTAVIMTTVNPPVGKREPDVVIIGHQFWWEYRYPRSGVITANELYLPQGQNLLCEVRGADVVHSFWVPAFGEKMDAIPGHPNRIFYTPLKTGLFLGQCSEYCGAEHGLMRILAYVVPPADFDKWIKNQQKVPAVGAGAAGAQHGQALFMTHTCVGCHSIAGTAANARIAPDLTHIADRKTIGTGVIANNVDNLTRWIMNPQQFKPGCNMPSMHLSQSDAHDIAVYLESLK